jgi:hypothetical protein
MKYFPPTINGDILLSTILRSNPRNIKFSISDKSGINNENEKVIK